MMTFFEDPKFRGGIHAVENKIQTLKGGIIHIN